MSASTPKKFFPEPPEPEPLYWMWRERKPEVEESAFSLLPVHSVTGESNFSSLAVARNHSGACGRGKSNFSSGTERTARGLAFSG